MKKLIKENIILCLKKKNLIWWPVYTILKMQGQDFDHRLHFLFKLSWKNREWKQVFFIQVVTEPERGTTFLWRYELDGRLGWDTHHLEN